MTEDFDIFLKRALAPEERNADRAFIARVQARILWEERLQAESAALKARLLRQIMAVASLAVGLIWLAQSPDLSPVVTDSPAIVLAVLIALFGFLILVLNIGSDGASRRFSTR